MACNGKDMMEGIERELLVRGKRYDFFVGTLND
jgi:hypothetical protein